MVPPMLWVQNRYKARFRKSQRPAEVVEVRIQPEAPSHHVLPSTCVPVVD